MSEITSFIKFFIKAEIWDWIDENCCLIKNICLHPKSFFEQSVLDIDIYCKKTLKEGNKFLIIMCILGVLPLVILVANRLDSLHFVLLWIILSTFIWISTKLCGWILYFSWTLRNIYTPLERNAIKALYLYHAGTFNVLVSAANVFTALLFAYLTGSSIQHTYFYLMTESLRDFFVLVKRYGVSEVFYAVTTKAWTTDILFIFMQILIVFSLVFIYIVWGFPAWCAYKKTLSASFLRTIIAFLIFCLSSLCVVLIFSFIEGILILKWFE